MTNEHPAITIGRSRHYKAQAIRLEILALRFIQKFKRERDNSPTLAQLGKCDDPPWSKSKAHTVARRLGAKGYIAIDEDGKIGRVLKGPEDLEAELGELARDGAQELLEKIDAVREELAATIEARS